MIDDIIVDLFGETEEYVEQRLGIPNYKMYTKLSKWEILTLFLQDIERHYDNASEEVDKWRVKEIEARQKDQIKKAHYHQRKKAYAEGYADGLFMARYLCKIFRDEV